MEVSLASRLTLPVLGSLVTPPTFSEAVGVPPGDVSIELQVVVIVNTCSFPSFLQVSLQISNDEVTWSDLAGSSVSFSEAGSIGLKVKNVDAVAASAVRLKYAPGSDPEVLVSSVIILAAGLVFSPA